MLMILAFAALSLRPNPQPLTPAQARGMTPAALGDALLAPGHPPAVEAVIGTEGMEPPPPPGPTETTHIRLYLKPMAGKDRGFCERIVATVMLRPAQRLGAGALAPALPDTLSTARAYRWIGTGPSRTGCDAPRWNFFSPDPADTPAALNAVRQLARAVRQAKTGAPLPFPVSVDDQVGPAMLDYERTHPMKGPSAGFKVITNGREALAALPIEMARYAGPAGPASPNILQSPDLILPQGRNGTGMTIFMGDVWTAGIVLDRDRIVRIRLRRAYPAPF